LDFTDDLIADLLTAAFFGSTFFTSGFLGSGFFWSGFFFISTILVSAPFGESDIIIRDDNEHQVLPVVQVPGAAAVTQGILSPRFPVCGYS
jgi:hypothetical protein